MKTKNEFPIALLSASKEKRFEYFKNKVIAHPKLTRAYDELLELINDLPPGSLIFAYGPTGIGKTTLSSRLVQHILTASQSKMEQDSAHLPVAAMEVALSDADSFSWRDYYKRALLCLDALFVVNGTRFNGTPTTIQGLDTGNRGNRYDYRWALEQEFRQRTTKIFITDEAQHFKKITGGRRMLNQMDTLKSLANITQVTHVLIGTYELTMDSLSAQLDRRSESVHFSRYHYDDPTEFLEFKSIIFNFQSHLPLPIQPNLVDQVDFLYERTLGCVGVLKQLLNKSLKKALDQNKQTITKTILESQSLSNAKLVGMAREIVEGEEALKDKGNKTELHSLLQMSTKVPSKKTPSAQNTEKKRKHKPFQRKPIRDKGGNYESTI